MSLLNGPEASIDAGIVGDIEPNELRTECVGGRAPLLLVARGQDRSEAVLDQLPHDLATDPSIRTRNKSESTLVRHRPSRSHPRRLRPAAVWDRPGKALRVGSPTRTRHAQRSNGQITRPRTRAGQSRTKGFSTACVRSPCVLPPGTSGRPRPDPPSARRAGSDRPDRRDGRGSGRFGRMTRNFERPHPFALLPRRISIASSASTTGAAST